MNINRSSGILMHITSLPGKYGIGTLGQEAYDFANILKTAGQSYWQILPIGPVMPIYGYSPYASKSSFAGNYLFISLEKLSHQPWFKQNIDTDNFEESHNIDYVRVAEHKLPLLHKACDDFFTHADSTAHEDYNTFCQNEHYWLEDFSLFTALAKHFNTYYWLDWDPDIARRKPQALERWSKRLESETKYLKFIQYIFNQQWQELKNYCSNIGIKIIGDIPIYISYDGSDTWAHTDILQIDPKTYKQTHVAGVPPDYFSETGQRWGNPLYRWEDENGQLVQATIDWWAQRIRHLNNFMHIIRIDHFRGFEAYWSISAVEETAINGEWITGPGSLFFKEIKKQLGNLPLIAEDLGVITPEVRKLRDDLNLPGMKILQFAFDGNNKNEYLPHNITNSNCILYTGTHDNNTSNGWFYGDEINDARRAEILEYMGCSDIHDFHWKIIRLAYASTANLVIIPIQDLLGYGKEFRMNTPGTLVGNWGFKLTSNNITEDVISRLKRMTTIYRREPEHKGHKDIDKH